MCIEFISIVVLSQIIFIFVFVNNEKKKKKEERTTELMKPFACGTRTNAYYFKSIESNILVESNWNLERW